MGKNPNCYAYLGNYFEDEDAYCRPLPKQVRTSICYACLRNYFGAGDAYWALLGSKGKQRVANQNYFGAVDPYWGLLGSNGK